MSTSGRRALAVALAVGVLATAGCTKDDGPDFPTAGALTADDLGAGDWSGPYKTWADPDGGARGSMCPQTTDLWSVMPPAESKATAVWKNGDVLVWSLAFRYASPTGAAEKMASTRGLRSCVDLAAAPGSGWTFTFDDDGTTVTTHEKNTLDGGVEVETASTSKGDTVAEVVVSYPAGEAPDVSAQDLLDAAVQASAALPES